MNACEIVGVAFGAVAVWLTVRENVWCWPIGLVNVGLFIIVFAQAKLYADMGLQVVYVALCLYGWYAWLHGGEGRSELRVSKTPAAALWALALAGTGFAAILGWFLRVHTDAALPYWDASTASFSLVAQWMQTRKWVENWLVWIVVDVVYVGMYVFKGLFLTAGLYATFLALAGLGLAAWRRSLRTA
jgi:nicotinamide mononucleotide transporter